MKPGQTLNVGGMPHLPQLDGIRALAVSMVFLAHAGFGHVVPGGLGVTVFFFLSGYLITTLMRFETLRTASISLPQFYLRRAFRILPPLYLTMIFSIILYSLGILKGPYDPFVVLTQAAFLVNYVAFLGGDINLALPIPLWSLAVEEHFYFLFPLVFLMARASVARLAAFCFAACILVLGIRIAGTFMLTEISDTYIWTHTRIDSILFGCCLALWRNPLLDGKKAYRPGSFQATLALAVLVGTVLIRDENFRQTLRYTIQGSALFVLFAAILQPVAKGICGRVVQILSVPVMRLIGLYSYTIYLVHAVMIDAVAEYTDSQLTQIIIALILTLAYAAMMHYFIERPFARLRRRLDTSNAPRLASPILPLALPATSDK